jgi:putative acetyltransferase
MCTIRAETPDDIPAIHRIHTAAFGRPNEADLVDMLRQHNALTISLVAVQDSHIVGHIAFSPVTITSSTATITALGLAPLAVPPGYQRRGIGSRLVEVGLTACHHTPYGVVVERHLTGIVWQQTPSHSPCKSLISPPDTFANHCEMST